MKKIPLSGKFGALKEISEINFASRKVIYGKPFIILPFKSTDIGDFRKHFIRQFDKFPKTIFSWRENDVEYIAFPHEYQRVMSIYHNDRGIVRVQVIEPVPDEDGKYVIELGETSLEAAENLIQNPSLGSKFVQISPE